MPNKRTGQDYLEAQMKKRNAEQHKKFAQKQMKKQVEAQHKKQREKYEKAVLKGPPGKLKPIGTAKGKAKITPLKKKKK
jgi:hypothetical protein